MKKDENISRIKKYHEKDINIKQEEKEKRKENRKRKRNKFILIIVILISIGAIYSRTIEPQILLTNEYKITSSNITSDFHGLKIVQFSDLHYGSTIHEKELIKITNEINKLKPDILVFTGDLIDNRFQSKMTKDDLKIITKYLNKMNASLSKYAILGNQDIKEKDISNIYYDASFIVLNNSYDIIYGDEGNTIGIFGFDDTLYGNPNNKLLFSEEFKNTIYKIVLVHEPDYIDNFLNEIKVDLILAGHSHGGQINIPYLNKLWLPVGAKSYYKSYYNINNTPIYVSNGIGESTLNLRLFSPPSINLFRLNKKQ